MKPHLPAIAATVFFLALVFSASAQLVDTTIMLNNLVNIDSLNRLSMGKEEIHKYFYSFQEHPNSEFDGYDTSYVMTSTGKITVLLYYRSGEKIKTIGYYDNGNKYAEANFSNRKLHGFIIWYYKNGNKKNLTYYENGEIIYPDMLFYESGMIWSIHNVNEMDRKSKITEWYESGKLKREVFALDTSRGPFPGIEKKYYENGALMENVIYNAGIQNFLAYHENGEKAWEGKIVDWAGYQVGKWLEWHQNGQMKREYIFNDSIPNYRNGTWNWWNEKGDLIKQEIYKDNVLVETKEFLPEIKKKEK